MKTITHLFTSQIEIRRLRTVTGRQATYQATATVECAPIQQRDRGGMQRLGILEEYAFMTWVDAGTDIKMGDRIIDSRGTLYFVKEVSRKEYGTNTHLEIILDRPNE